MSRACCTNVDKEACIYDIGWKARRKDAMRKTKT
jgi:hypothetical protein